MEKMKVAITDQQKSVKLPAGTRLLIRRACNAVLVYEQFLEPAEVNVLLVDDENIRALNAQFRNIDSATDVLSFPLGQDGEYDENPESGKKMLGDIVINVPQAERQAEEYGHSFQREMAFLTVHSMLHLLGYDHVQGGMQQVKMREREEAVLLQMGLPRTSSYYIEE